MALGISPTDIINNSRNPLIKTKRYERVKIKDIAEIINGFAFKSSKFNKVKGLPVIRIRDINSGYTDTRYNGEYQNKYLVYKDDLLVGMDGDFNAILWHGDKSLLNQRVCKIDVDEKKFNKKFLFYMLQPFLDEIHKYTSAVTVKHLSSNTIAEIPVLFPKLSEQNKITEKLDEMFSIKRDSMNTIANLRHSLEVYKQSILMFAFTGNLTPEYKVKYGNIEKHASIQAGYAFKKSEYSKTGVRLFQIANVTFNKTIWEKEAFLPINYKQSYKHLLLQENDIVLALNRPLLSDKLKIAQITASDLPAILYQRVGKFIFKDDAINPKYLLYFLQSPLFIQWLKEQLRGVNIPFINQSKLLSYDRFPYIDLDAQLKIINYIEESFSVIDYIESMLNNTLTKGILFEKSVLKSAFSGKLVKEE